MLLDKQNLIMAKAMALIFHCLMLFQPERCLLAYHSMYNIFFMDLPVSSFVFHSSLLIAKTVDLVVAHDVILARVIEIIHIFHSGYLDYRGTFQLGLDSYRCVTS